MKLRTLILLLGTHALVGSAGFAAGIYVLPILTAPPSPTVEQVQSTDIRALYRATVSRDLAGSDALHWGEGTLSVGRETIALHGRLAPGPDYRLYLSPAFVEDEAQFNRLKPSMVEVGPVRTFDNFLLNVPPGIDPSDYTTAIVWCETFGEFITAARYR